MPEEFGRYRLLELIGRGGMGEVYRALDTVRERTVALKLLPDYLAGDESFETRFRRESRMAARLNEPHIIPIHDFGEIDGRLFIDMRLVEGRDLGSLLETRGTLPVEMAVDVIAQAASALDAAHAGGLVHRDVKPSNILLTGIDRDPNAVPFAYLVDFGIARASSGEGTALTATTTTVGTVAYMAPERISGQPGDLRADVYALACVLYETLAGRKPFEGEMFAQMYAHMNTPPPHAAASRPEIPASLDAVIATGMAKSPADRYGSAGALAAAARTALRESAREDTVRRSSISGPVAPAGPVGPAGPAAPVGPVAPAGPVAPGRGWTPPPPGVSSPGPIGSRPPNAPSAPPRGRNLTGPPPGAPGTGPHDRPPSLHPPLAGGGHSGSSRRNAVLVAVTVIVLALAAVVGVVAYRGHDNSAAPGPTGSPTRGSTGASSGFPPSDEPTLRTGEAGTPAVSWAHFAAFSGLVGTRDKDTDHSFDGNTCTLSAATTSDARSGAVDEVQCVSHISAATITVARFGTGDQVQSYLHDRLDTDDYHQLVWTSAGLPRGITIVTPRSGTGPGVIITSMCGLPNYLVQISSPDRTKLTTLQLYNKFWIMATFPDVTPPECDATYVAAKAGAKAEASVGPAKDVLPMTSDVIRTLVQRGDTSLTVVQVGVKGGTDVLGVGQRGSVSFYTEEADTLTLAGTSTYPYSPSGLGAPGAAATGSVLTGMKDATFVVRGTFSGDGSGNAVAYTNGSKGWGAIKARPDGTLAPSGQGVGISGLGLSADFGLVDGRLQTVDCSKALPTSECSGNNRVIKYWSWRKTYFTQTGSAGRSR